MKRSQIFAVLASLLLPAALPSISQAQNTDPICSDLSGAAFGQCTAAVAVGCDGTANQPAGCTRIAENFTRLTGTAPPWELGSCSCYTYEDIVSDVRVHVASGESLVWCATATSFIIQKGKGCELRTATPEFGAALVDKAGTEVVGTCINHGPVQKLFTPGEPEACLATIKKAAADTNLTTQ